MIARSVRNGFAQSVPAELHDSQLRGSQPGVAELHAGDRLGNVLPAGADLLLRGAPGSGVSR